MRAQDLAGAITASAVPDPEVELVRLRRRFDRERKARLQAEGISEGATRELYRKQLGLELLQEITAAANKATRIDQALQVAVDRVCAHTGWPVGHVYLRDSESEPVLGPSGIWHLADPERFANFRAVTEKTRFESGFGLPGRVLASGTSHWIEDVTRDPNFQRADAASDVNVRSGFGAPILVETRVEGVLEFFTDLAVAPDEDLLETMLYVGTQLGRVIERRRAEEELRKHRDHLEELVAERTAALSVAYKELEGFAYSVSHDLRAPLRSMDGFSQALLEDYEGKLDAEGADYLRRIRTASQRMADLIDDLLQLSRVARSEMRRETVNLSEMVERVAAQLREQEPERRVTFAIEEGVIGNGDERLLEVVLENLLGNAWKFTSKHPEARIEFGAAEQDDGPAYFVRDDGAGFDMEYAEKLFGAFQRLHSIADFDGTGVGLATVQRIIHRHGGRVWAEGEPEGGATFYFTLQPGKES